MKIRLTIISLAILISSCSNDMVDINRLIDTETEPDMITINAIMFHSDSGRLQIKAITPLRKHFSSTEMQRDEYPEGLQVWLYDRTGEISGELTANWAKYRPVEDLWEARYNVVLTRANGEVLETEQFFWDVNRAVVYSETHTTITQPNGSVVRGIRFSANQDFTDLRLPQGSATIVLEDIEEDEDEIVGVEEIIED